MWRDSVPQALQISLFVALVACAVGVVLGGLTGGVIALALGGLDATMGGWAWLVGLFACGGLAAGIHLLLPLFVGVVYDGFSPFHLLLVGVPTLIYVVAGTLLTPRFYRKWYQ